jgi:hypothetical protein
VRLHNLSGALASIGDRNATFSLPHGRGDAFHHGGRGQQSAGPAATRADAAGNLHSGPVAGCDQSTGAELQVIGSGPLLARRLTFGNSRGDRTFGGDVSGQQAKQVQKLSSASDSRSTCWMENQMGSALRTAVRSSSLEAERSSSRERNGFTVSSPSTIRMISA